MRLKILLSILIFSISLLSYGQNISVHKQKKAQIEKEISNINKQLSNTKSQQRQTLNNLALVKRKISNRKALINEIDNELKTINANISTIGKDINRLEIRLDTLETYSERLIYKTYRNRDSRIWFMHIFASENIGQGIRRWSYLKNISKKIEHQAEEIQNTKELLFIEKDKLNTLRKENTAIKQQRVSEYNDLNKDQQYATNTINKLKQKERQFTQELAKKRKQVDALNKQIEKILAEAVKGQKSEGKDEIKINYALSAKFSENKGKLPWPTKYGVIVDKFGQSYHPVLKNIKMPFNNGIDISNSPNAKAYSVFDGVVKQILVMPGYNQCVLVQHGEYFTFYCKLHSVDVKVGDQIKVGSSIGTIENTDNIAILHFQIWKGTTKQNPEYWLIKK